MKIAFAGDSHSTNVYGKCWSSYLKDDLNCEMVDISCAGVGNEMLIEKIKYVLDNDNVDYFIFQLTDPSRLVLGLSGNDVEEEYTKYQVVDYYHQNINCYRETNKISYNTFKVLENEDYINKVLNTNYVDVQKFMDNHVLISDFNLRIKIFHTLMAIQFLIESYGKKILFFSWFVDIKEMSKQSKYEHILERINILDGCVEDFAKKNKLDKHSDGFHYGSNAHKIIYEEFLSNYIKNFINL